MREACSLYVPDTGLPGYSDTDHVEQEQVYELIEADADVNFVFGQVYSCPEGYTPLMVAAHRDR